MAERALEPGGSKPDWVEQFEKALADHYKEPVRPVSHYCNALTSWRRAVLEADERGDYENDGGMQSVATTLRETAMPLDLAIRKSNLLYRLIYLGEPLRSEPCPEHKGHWSGCAYGDGVCEHCMAGMDVTGWVAKP